MVQSPHLWLSCRHPVLVYTTIDVIALHEAPLHVVGPFPLPHLCECLQAISVGVLYMGLTFKGVCRSHYYIPTLVTLYSTSLCGTLSDKQAWAMQVLLQGKEFH